MDTAANQVPSLDGYQPPSDVSSQATIKASQAKLAAIESELGMEVFERSEAIRSVLVAILSREHLVFLGPPGSAKTQLIRKAAARFTSANNQGLSYFFALLTRFTKPDELLGPLDVQALKAGEYRYVTARRLPEAQVVFLSEIFKSSSAILNTLLMIMNERLFDDGSGMKEVPLLSLFGDSNEMPQGDDLAALWDRLLIRQYVTYLSQGGFKNLLYKVADEARLKSTPHFTTMTQLELTALQSHVSSLPISTSILDALTTLRKELQDEKGIVASDRRWVESLGVLKAHAVIEGKMSVDEDDISMLTHVLWSTPEQRGDIAKKVAKLANPTVARAVELKDSAQEILDQTRSAMKQHESDPTKKMLAAAEGSGKLYKIVDEMNKLAQQANLSGRTNKRLTQAKTGIDNIYAELLREVGITMKV